MVTALYILHVLVCLAMLPIILLQSGKGGGVSAVFGGGGSGNVLGSRGASNFLTRMTTGAAIVFMMTSMGLSYVSSQSRSVVSKVPMPAAADGAATEGAAGAGESGDVLDEGLGAPEGSAAEILPPDDAPPADLNIELGNEAPAGSTEDSTEER